MRIAVLVLAVVLVACALTSAGIAYVKAKTAQDHAQTSLAMMGVCALAVVVWRFMA